MTPQEALAALARPGWGWTVYSQHYSDGGTKFHICGNNLDLGAALSVIDVHLAVAVAGVIAKLAEAEYDPYAMPAAAPERTAA